MIIGLPKEIKIDEYRVGLTPNCVREYIKNSHTVIFESNCGYGSGFSDDEYIKAGAKRSKNKKELFDIADMIVKVKEPLESEFELLKENSILFTYLHLAANKKLFHLLLTKKITAIAYETIRENNQLPCLVPMSEIAGKLSIQIGAKYLEKTNGGKGFLIGGSIGTNRGNVVILGAGVVGENACKIAVGMGANVTILNRSYEKLEKLENMYNSKITTLYSSRENIINSIINADLIVGAVLNTGDKSPILIQEKDLKLLKKKTVLVDVSIDQGGCFETSKLTYHNDPVYQINDIIHYCVGNIPGIVPMTSTKALTSATLKYGIKIANSKNIEVLFKSENPIKEGLNSYKGECMIKKINDLFIK